MSARSGVGPLFLSVVLGVSSLCASPATARAEDPAKAGALAEAALARVNQGERRMAIDLYEEAYNAAPRREYIRAIAGLYEALSVAGDPRDVRLAILYYERVLLLEDPQAPDRVAIETRLTRLRGRKATMRPEPTVQVPERVPLHLLSYKSDQTYGVWVGDDRCATPCTLSLRPGPAKLRTTGSGEVNLEFVVPSQASQIKLQHTEANGFVAGAVLVPAGIVTGASLWALGFLCDSSSCYVANFTVWPILGLSAMITGIVLLAGGRGTPPADANRVELVGRHDKPRLRFASAGFAPQAGGASAGLKFEF